MLFRLLRLLCLLSLSQASLAQRSGMAISEDMPARCPVYKAVSDQPFCSTLALPSKSTHRHLLVRHGSPMDTTARDRNVERVTALHPH